MAATRPDVDVGTLVLRLRASRAKARQAAVAELSAVLRGLDPTATSGGPLSEVAGVTWVNVPAANLPLALDRVNRLGYTNSVRVVRPRAEDVENVGEHVRWRRRDVALMPVYEEPDEGLQRNAPDVRSFLLECGDGVVRSVNGYRGGRGPLEHRALPVVDARLLINLVFAVGRGLLLDPFAGAGGVALEARTSGWTTASVDIDPALRFGLSALGAHHVIGDARALPFATASIDAVATEPPYHPSALSAVVASVGEIARVLRSGARAALLVSAAQAQDVLRAAANAGLATELTLPINRKGTEVTGLCLVR